MPWAEQAVFTSIRGPRLDGYQLAAKSPGISSETAKELTQWGPAHDSLYDPPVAQPSIAWFPLSDGQYSLAVTQPTAGEYSGRQGPRVYTHFLVIAAAVVERLANPAWQIYRALNVAGRFLLRDPLPQRMERCPISVLPAAPLPNHSEANQELAAVLCERFNADHRPGTLVIPCAGAANSRFEALWWTLSEPLRRSTSFCTGLRYSLRRPFAVQAAPNDAALLRRFSRESGVEILDFVLQNSLS